MVQWLEILYLESNIKQLGIKQKATNDLENSNEVVGALARLLFGFACYTTKQLCSSKYVEPNILY